MKDSLILQDKNYISARRVHELFGYTTDYVGQLCRAGKLDSKMIGRAWFVTEQSVRDHLTAATEIVKNKTAEKKNAAKKLYQEKVAKKSSPKSPIITARISPVNIETNIETNNIEVSRIIERNNIKERQAEKITENKIVEQEKIGVPVYANIEALPIEIPVATTRVEERIAEVEESIRTDFGTESNLKIMGLVPTSFSLPFYISDSFKYNIFESPRKRSTIIIGNFTNLGLTAGVLAIAFIFFFQNVLPTNFSAEVVRDLGKNSTASLVSSTKEIGNKIATFFDEIFNKEGRVIVKNDTPAVEEEVPFNGLAVVPATDSPAQNEIIKEKIRQSFSDDVVVSPDESGTAGVITPVFRKAKGDDFLYVLVPVAQADNNTNQ